MGGCSQFLTTQWLARVVIFSGARGRGPGNSFEALAAVLLTGHGELYAIESARSPDVLPWLVAAGEQRINECESLAALLAIASFGPVLVDTNVLHFIDPWAAEGMLAEGYSTSRTLAALAGAYWHTAAKHRAAIWIGRVPSKLSLADGPTQISGQI